MGKEPSRNETEAAGDITAVSGPAPGGTLSEFVEYQRSLGRGAALSRDGKYAWVPGVKGELQRFPLECNEPVGTADIREVLALPKIRMVSYLVDGDQAHPPNCFDYVCRRPDYSLDSLSKNARRDIRRGLRSFVVRLCTWDELAAKGFVAHAETAERHGYAAAEPRWLEEMVARQRDTPFHEIWGAWQGADLAAWMTIIKIDDWALVDIARSCTGALKGCPNNAILYEASRHLLAGENRKYVTYGLSSIQVDVNERSMHRYKTRMGYEPLPVRRVFESRGPLRLILKSTLLSWIWEKSAKALPRSAALKKLAGMSRILSGREKAPLDWAEKGD